MKDSKKNFLINKYKTEDLKGLEKFQNDLKEFIFGVFYILLKNDSENYIFFFIVRLLEFMQLIFFCFQDILKTVWKNDDAFDLVQDILTKVDIVHYFKNKDNSSVFLITFYICFFIVICFLINFIYLAIMFNKSIFSDTWKVIVFKYSCKLASSCLVLPFLLMFFSVFSCNSDNFMTFSIGIKCYSGFHFLHIFTSVIAILIIIFMCFVIALVYYEYSNKYSNISAKLNTDYDLVVLIAKILLVCLYIFLPDVSLFNIFYIYMIICYFLYMYILNLDFF